MQWFILKIIWMGTVSARNHWVRIQIQWVEIETINHSIYSLFVSYRTQFSQVFSYIYRILNEFSFHTVFMKWVVCFISPSLWQKFKFMKWLYESWNHVIIFIIIQLRQMFASKLCNFILCNYIQMSLLIRSIVLSLHTQKILTFSPLLLHGKIPVKRSSFFQVYRDITIVPISSSVCM